jgi:hypothetical protein
MINTRVRGALLQKKGFRVNFGLVAKAKSLAGDEQIE